VKIPYVHTKRAKGQTYLYFDTGVRKAGGAPILTPLGKPDDPLFGRRLADAQRARTMRKTPRPEAMTIARLASLYEKSDRFQSRSPATRRIYARYLEILRDQLGEAVADELTTADAQLLLDSMADTPAAANLTVKVMGALYQWGRKRHHVKAEPTKGIEYLEIGEHQPWPEPLLDAALRADEPLVRNAVALLYFTAQRIGDVMKMQWTALAGGRVRVRQEKTDADLDFAMHPELAEILASVPRVGMTVLSKPDGHPYAASTVRQAIQAWAKAQGEAVVPHGLRKNAVNALLESGCSVAETQAISGQSLAMIEHYAKRRNRSRLGDAAVLKWKRNV
jgi:integrase